MGLFPFGGGATARLQFLVQGKVCDTQMCEHLQAVLQDGLRSCCWQEQPGRLPAMALLLSNTHQLPLWHPHCHCGHCRHRRALTRALSRFVLLCSECSRGTCFFQFHLTFEMYILILNFCYGELFLIIVSWKMIK